MKIEDKVCTLEQAKKLASLGVMFTEPTENIWHSRQNPGYMKLLKFSPMMYLSGIGYFAPDVAELGAILHKLGYGVSYVDTRKFQNTGEFWFDLININEESFEIDESFCVGTEAQARANALIWLLENKQVKPEGVKL